MAIEPVKDTAESTLRDYVFFMLRDGHALQDVMTAMAALKVEMARVMQYQQAVKDIDFAP